MSLWVYVLGERQGAPIKIGKTDAATVRERINGVNGAQMSDQEFVLLAAVRGDPTAEKELHDYFGGCRQPRGRHREYYHATDELIGYVLWLRSQWFVSLDANDTPDLVGEEERNHWLPRPERRLAPPPPDADALFSRHLQLQGPLAGTEWSWMPDPNASFQDYFTPADIVRRAFDAMGGIDLDRYVPFSRQ